MKQQVAELLTAALEQLSQTENWPKELQEQVFARPVQVENTRDKAHGDVASNIAMTLAKPLRAAPKQIAEKIVAALPATELVVKAEIAGPGFINLFLAEGSAQQIINTIFEQGEHFGRSQEHAGQKVQVEFASVNPTGPLHVGHGRGAAYGATLANILAATGWEVTKEYYVNDAGRQMDILALSVWLRYLQHLDEDLQFPSNAYQGDYILDIAKTLHKEHGESLQYESSLVFENVPADEPQGGDKETHIDALIENARKLLGEKYGLVFKAGLETILQDIREDLGEFGVEFDVWFSELSLTSGENAVASTIAALQEKGVIEERDGALWFKSTDYGDDKDRVVTRDNGLTTYFASDIAYHRNKFERGFDRVIDVWGADHHGYIARVNAALEAQGLDPNKLTVKLIQMVSLFRGSEPVKMTTRGGMYVTLRELREEVGNDAARFFYIMKKVDQATEFDLELAKSQTKDNPVFYIQYAHARVCSVQRKLEERKWQWNKELGLAATSALTEDSEKAIMTQLARYPEVLMAASNNLEPHSLANYLRELAGDFHSYYNATKVLVDDEALRNARIALSEAVRQVIKNGLDLLGVSSPEEM